MKTEIKIPETRTNRFPLLAKSKDTGQVVLFLNSERGITVVKGSTINDIGLMDDTFVPIHIETTWNILPPGTQVILTQE